MFSMMSSASHQIVFGSQSGIGALAQDTFNSMCKARYKIFKQRLAWSVPTVDDRERDEFDDSDAQYILIVRSETGEVEGGMRIRPTTGPYMLKDVFPQLMGGAEIPKAKNVMELSRFGILTTAPREVATGTFANMTHELFYHAMTWGISRGVDSYVWVTTAPIERLVRRSLHGVTRLCPIQKVGDIACVVGRVPVNIEAAEHCLSLVSSNNAVAA